jgi:NhaA family Na+:H+ antiporter
MSNATDQGGPVASEFERIFQPSQWFFTNEVISALLLLLASVSAVYWANSFLAGPYHHFLEAEFAVGLGRWEISHSLHHWINDGLMTIFFFTVGLEIKREVLVGELASVKKAMLPVAAALGGMLIPGAIYMAFNYGTEYAGGWGIPMATDIAFSLGAVALFGRGLPVGLRIFLAAFAIADDLGAVLVIAVFYTQDISWHFIVLGAHFLLALGLLNLLSVRSLILYGLLGFGAWLAAMGSGVHPTIAGVLVALTIPAQGKYNTLHFVKRVHYIMENFQCQEQSCDHRHAILFNQGHLNAVQSLEMACHHVETPLQRLEHAFHPWVAFLILPLFAFANAGLTFGGMTVGSAVSHPVTLGIALGLFVGKPLGILCFSFLAVRLGLAELPESVRWSHILGAGMLGGIGFTMSLFISGLAFTDAALLNYSKLGILSGSIFAIVAGALFLGWVGRREATTSLSV